MARVNVNYPNQHIISAGMSGSGKSHFVKEKIKAQNPDRLLIFDVNDEFSELNCQRFTTAKDLALALIATKRGRFRLVAPDKDNYRLFCLLAKAWANADDGDTVVVIEEAASVSHSGKSVDGELQLITQGRKFGISICYIVQSLAEGSKTALKNIDTIRIGNSNEIDIKYLKNQFGEALSDAVRKLTGHQFVIFTQSNKKFKLVN